MCFLATSPHLRSILSDHSSGIPVELESTMANAPKKLTKAVTNSKTGKTRDVKYGLTAAGRKGTNLKAPQPQGGKRKDSYCARSAGINKAHPKTARNPNSPNNLSRRRWGC